MAEFMYGVRVPKERIPIIIGKEGKTKKELQEFLGVSINVDSEDGDVTVKGDDALKLYVAREVIKAIARGFNPEYALDLIKNDYSLELIDLKDFAKNKKQLIRKRGRVIGENGKSRKTIEDLSETKISVYGKTIGIIGRADDVLAAKRAVESLLGEAPHSAVYKQLEKRRADERKKKALWLKEDINIPEELK